MGDVVEFPICVICGTPGKCDDPACERILLADDDELRAGDVKDDR